MLGQCTAKRIDSNLRSILTCLAQLNAETATSWLWLVSSSHMTQCWALIGQWWRRNWYFCWSTSVWHLNGYPSVVGNTHDMQLPGSIMSVKAALAPHITAAQMKEFNHNNNTYWLCTAPGHRSRVFPCFVRLCRSQRGRAGLDPRIWETGWCWGRRTLISLHLWMVWEKYDENYTRCFSRLKH